MTNKRLTAGCALWCAAFYLISFFIYYVPAYLLNAPEAVIYIAAFIRDFALALFPLLFSLVLVKIYATLGIRGTLLYAIPLALPILAYALPYYYVYFTELGYKTSDALILLLIQIPLSLIPSYVKQLSMCLIFILLHKKLSSKIPNYEVDLSKKLDTGAVISAEEPITVSIFASAFLTCAISLIGEIYDTVIYLKSYYPAYRTEEIIYIIIKYVFILFTLIFTTVIARKFREKISN